MTISRTGVRGRLSGRPGFTLIEILIAVSILSFGMMGILRAYSASVTAMENAQYSIDAAYLLKAVMGGIEEKAITQRGTPAGTSSGNLDKWLWNTEVRQTELQVNPSTDNTVSETTDEPEGYYLNEVSLTVANPMRNPAKNINLTTYMESESVES